MTDINTECTDCMESKEYPPIKVHVASSDVDIKPAKKQRTAIFRTFVLSSATPVDRILGPEPNRVIAYVQAGGNNVVLAGSKAQAQASANINDTTLANANGCILPYNNTTPYPLETTTEVWAAAASYPAQVTMTVIYERDA